MNREILYHSAIQRELRDILAYYDAISASLADDLWEELSEAFDYARKFPERHHFDPSGRRRSNLKKFPYHFLFITGKSQIKVTVLRHNSQNPFLGNRRS